MIFFLRGHFSCSAWQTSGVVKVMSQIDGFLLWKVLNKYVSFSIPKESLQVSCSEGILFGFFFLGYAL